MISEPPGKIGWVLDIHLTHVSGWNGNQVLGVVAGSWLNYVDLRGIYKMKSERLEDWVLETRMRKGLASIHFSMLSIIYFYWTLSIFHPQNLTYIFMFNTHQYSPLKNNLLFYLNCSQDTTIVLFIIFHKAICNTVPYNLMIEKKLTYYYAFLK